MKSLSAKRATRDVTTTVDVAQFTVSFSEDEIQEILIREALAVLKEEHGIVAPRGEGIRIEINTGHDTYEERVQPDAEVEISVPYESLTDDQRTAIERSREKQRIAEMALKKSKRAKKVKTA